MQAIPMILDVELPNGHAASLSGSGLTYWYGTGLPDYKGPLNDAPQDMIDALLKAGAIKPVFEDVPF